MMVSVSRDMIEAGAEAFKFEAGEYYQRMPEQDRILAAVFEAMVSASRAKSRGKYLARQRQSY